MSDQLIVLEFIVSLVYISDRPLGDILTEIRAIKGVTIVNILERSEKMYNNKFYTLSNLTNDNMQKILLSIKVEISKLHNMNISYFLKNRINRIKSVKNCFIKPGA
jgi:hypothetical protein